MLFPDLRCGRKYFYIASRRDVVPARQCANAGDLRYRQTAARKTAQSAVEFTLLVLPVGGQAIVGQQLFRHKTQKQPFKNILYRQCDMSIVVTVAIHRLIHFVLLNIDYVSLIDHRQQR